LPQSDIDNQAAQVTAAQDGSAPGAPRAMLAETKQIAASLEPELRRVIDMTMDRVAEIERQTLHEARQLMASSEHDSQDAVERSSRLVNSLEALTGTVNEVTSALRTEADEVTEALRALHGLNVELPQMQRERPTSAAPQPPSAQAPLGPESAPVAPPEPAPTPPAADAQEAPDPEIEPSPELTEMYRQHIIRMRDDGKSRDEAERVLRGFRFGRRFSGMLDEIYLSAPPRTRRLFGRLRGRGH
jgi:hypothetical protein